MLQLVALVLLGDVLHDNGPWVTHLGIGFGGAPVSVLAAGASTAGYGCEVSENNRLADDFTVNGQWAVTSVTLYAFQWTPTAPPVPPPATITALYVRIWDGPPNNAESEVVFGDTTTNRLIATSFTGVYRVPELFPTNTQRPILMQRADLTGLILNTGTYWLDWQCEGSLPVGPHANPIAIAGQSPIGNALQFDGASGKWKKAQDGATHVQTDFPFVLEGTSTAGCYADCEGDGDTDIFDFLCFQSAFSAGC